MNLRSRYEETDQQFNELPLPDEERSWQKMKELLNKDDDNEIVPPPVFFKSCLGWGLLFLGLIAICLIVLQEKRWSENSRTTSTSSPDKSFHQHLTPKNASGKPEQNAGTPARNSKGPIKKDPSLVTNQKQTETVVPFKQSLPAPTKKTGEHDAVFRNNKKKLPKQKAVSPGKAVALQLPAKNADVDINRPDDKKKKSDTISLTKDKDTAERSNAHADPLKDTATTERPNRNDSTSQKKMHQSLPKKFFLTAGIGEQLQIPIAGQTTVPYSHYGRKTSLSDYVPSVYVRWQKERKWFVQGEFRYGAAQYVKEFSYNRKTEFDAISKDITTTTMRLKKTYYHQLPLSFNYYILPNLSLGLGGMYSRFDGAVTEEEIKVQNVPTGTETITREIIPIKHFTDSFLYKTQVHVLVQADYQLKKFSFGLRYAKDIQPYIKYTRPDGTVDEEKNQSLQFIVRYRLWQSKRS
jgi:hypothetical protein